MTVDSGHLAERVLREIAAETKQAVGPSASADPTAPTDDRQLAQREPRQLDVGVMDIIMDASKSDDQALKELMKIEVHD